MSSAVSKHSTALEPGAELPVPDAPHGRALKSGSILTLAYVLGPFAPAALRQGKNNLSWTILAALAFLTWAGVWWNWPALRLALETGRVALVPWMLGLAVATGVWLVAWCRALFLAVNDHRFVPETLPAWIRRASFCAIIGLALPSFGYVVAGHARRAALVQWTTGSAVLPWLVLGHAAWIWQCNRSAGRAAVPDLAVEVVVLLAAVLAVLGALAWIAAALDGARLQALRAGEHGDVHGDRIALALLASLLLALMCLRPARLASDLDRFALSLQHDGYRLVPTCLEVAAMRLDRAEPRYAMACAELLDTMGKHESARALRDDLRRRWETYAEHLLQEEVRIGSILYPPLMTVTGEPERWPSTFGDSLLATPVTADSLSRSPALTPLLPAAAESFPMPAATQPASTPQATLLPVDSTRTEDAAPLSRPTRSDSL